MKRTMFFVMGLFFATGLSAEGMGMMSNEGGGDGGGMPGVSFFGDFKFRYQADDERQTQTAGTKIKERTATDFRLRMGAKYRVHRKLSFVGRLRTGTDQRDQQSGFQTMGDGFMPKNVWVDKAYAKGKFGRLKYKIGKHGFPFWKQNQLYWDDDVTPEGITLSQAFKGMGDSWKIRPVLGYYVIGSNRGAEGIDRTSVMAFQLNGKVRTGEHSKLKWGTGIINLADIPEAHELRNGFTLSEDGQKEFWRDYSLWVSSLKWASMMGSIPFSLGADYMSNMEDKDDANKSPLEDEKTGMAFSVRFGKIKDRGDWKLSYTYADIGKYAVAPQFAQDDWTSWQFSDPRACPTLSNALCNAGTRSSNFTGHGVKLAYGLSKHSKLAFSMYKVTTKTKEKDGTTELEEEDSNRMRLEYAVSFK